MFTAMLKALLIYIGGQAYEAAVFPFKKKKDMIALCGRKSYLLMFPYLSFR